MSHSSAIFYRRPKIESFHSSYYFTKMMREPFDHEAYLAFSRKAVLDNAYAMAEISALPKGVYLFGHNHLQWHMMIDDKIFINPGSCGMPLDFDISAPYTVLEHRTGDWHIAERRVPYDAEHTVNALLSSTLFSQAEIWSRIMMEQLKTGGDYISHFLRHVESLAQERRYPTRPVSNEIWHDAADTFKRLPI